jgi:hypothetical protein
MLYDPSCDDEPFGSPAVYTDDEPFEYQLSDCFETTTTATTAPAAAHNPDRDPRDIDPDAFLPPIGEQMATSRFCDDLQLEAVKHIVKQSRPLSDNAWVPLLERVKKMNFTEAQLKRCLKYIRDEAPIIIHVKLDQDNRLEKMIKDPTYRNQFETKCSNGSYDSSHTQRINWEDRLFNRVYHDAQPVQRPKYGCLNIVKDPKGIQSAYHYGDSYFVFKYVRLRCSFTDQDSGNSGCELSSCENYCHVLMRYSDDELKSVMKVANGLEMWLPSACIRNYKEVQFHGVLPLTECLEQVVVNPRHRNQQDVMEKLERFCKLCNCSYRFFDQ